MGSLGKDVKDTEEMLEGIKHMMEVDENTFEDDEEEAKKKQEYSQDAEKTIKEYEGRVSDSMGYFSLNYQQWLKNNRFAALSKQWEEQEISERTICGKPTLTFNICEPLVNEMLGQDRKSAPGLIIRPKNEDSEKDKEQTKIYDGIIRDILYASKFPIHRQEALKDAAIGGFGGFEVYRDYESPMSFDQKPGVRSIRDICGTFWDPSAIECDKSDGDYALKLYRMPLTKYHSIYGKEASEDSFVTPTNYVWLGQNTNQPMITLASGFCKKYKKTRICLMSDNRTVRKKDVEKYIAKQEELQQELIRMGELPRLYPLEVVDERDMDDYEVIETIMNGSEILLSQVFPSKYLPLVYFDGNSRYHEGMQYIRSYTDILRDIQVAYNYVVSEQITAIQYSTYDTFLVTPDQLMGHEEMWQDKNKGYNYRYYEPDARAAGPPVFQSGSSFPAELITLGESLLQAARQAMGQYSLNDGGRDKESGIARGMRIMQEDNTSNIWIDNANRAMEQVGRILVDMIPRLYDKTRVVAMREKDGTMRTAEVNSPGAQGVHLNTLTLDDFNVTVEAGVNYELQMAQERESLLQMTQINPAFGAATTDLLAGTYNIPNKAELVERAKLTLPPPIKAAIEGDESAMQAANQPPPEVLIEQQKLNLQGMEIQQKSEESKLKAQVEMQRIELDNKKMALEEMKIMQQAHKAETDVAVADTRADAEITKQALATQEAHFSHIGKIMDESDAHQEIKRLASENEKLKKQLTGG